MEGSVMHQLYRARVNDEGRLVIPAECRKQLGILSGQEVILQVDRTGIRLFTKELALRQLQDQVAAMVPPEVDLTQQLNEERRRDAGDR
jgi:AbrB family looped-hinge helix DNA binding protein